MDAAPSWSVIDGNAREPDGSGGYKKRGHEVVKGRLYWLSAFEPEPMIEAHARVLLKDPAFTVYNARGEIVPSLEAEQMSRKLPDALAPDMVVARLGELTDDALLTRASTLPNGQGFTGETHRDVLIDFISGVQTPVTPGSDDVGLGDREERVPAQQLEAMLPNKNLEF